jgi:hypothetical protein
MTGLSPTTRLFIDTLVCCTAREKLDLIEKADEREIKCLVGLVKNIAKLDPKSKFFKKNKEQLLAMKRVRWENPKTNKLKLCRRIKLISKLLDHSFYTSDKERLLPNEALVREPEGCQDVNNSQTNEE